jgi:putative mRNA 3-end processing factor
LSPRATTSRAPTPPAPRFEPVACDVFITEATFALPVFRHPDAADEIRRLLRSVSRNPDRAHLVGVYSLGKAQRVIRLIRDAGYHQPLYIHGALQKLCDYYESRGIALGDLRPATVDAGAKGDFAGAIVLGPPSAFGDKWARRFPDPLVSFASGWMQVRARARQRGVELPLVISDHADWDELAETIRDRGAGRGLGHPRPRGGAGALVRHARHSGQAACIWSATKTRGIEP